MKKIIFAILIMTAQWLYAENTVKTKYEAACAQLDAGYAQQKQAAVSVYTNALTTVAAKLKSQGDLDNLLAVQEELKRVALDATAPTTTNKYTTASAVAVTSALKRADDERRTRLSILAGQYVVALERTVKELVASDKIEEAKQLKAELEFVRSDIAGTTPAVVVAPVASSVPSTPVKATKKFDRDSVVGTWTSNGYKYEFRKNGALIANGDEKDGSSGRWELVDGDTAAVKHIFRKGSPHIYKYDITTDTLVYSTDWVFSRVAKKK